MKFKNEIWWMKLLGWLMYPFNSRFMTDYTTVINRTIYVPNREFLNKPNWYITVAHEEIHIKQREKLGFLWFSFLYTFPQNLSLLMVLALLFPISSWFLLFLIFLLALLPTWGGPFRAKFEAEAYTKANLRLNSIENFGIIDLSRQYKMSRPWLLYIFTGPEYYFMKYNEEQVDRLFTKHIKEFHNE